MARHPVGSGNIPHSGKRAKRHRTASRIAHANIQNILRIHAIGRVGLGGHAERLAEQVEIIDVGGADKDLQGGEHVRHVDAEELRLRAIDVEIELRRRILEQGEHLAEARRLRGFAHHRGCGFDQSLRTAALAVFHHHPEAAGIADARDRRRLHHQDQALLDAGEPLE